MKKSKIQIPVMLAIALALILAIVFLIRSLVTPGTDSRSASSAPAAESSQTAAAEPQESKEEKETIEAVSAIVGQYEITGMVTKGEETSPEDLALLKSKGLSCTIDLKADGTGTLTLFGEESAVTWDEKNIKAAGKTIPYTFKDDQITFTNGDASLTFTRLK